MSVDRWLCLLTDEEITTAEFRANGNWGESWFHAMPPASPCFDFGDGRDTDENGDRLYDLCEKLNGAIAYENLEELKRLYELSSRVMGNWQDIEESAIANPERKIFFWSE